MNLTERRVYRLKLDKRVTFTLLLILTVTMGLRAMSGEGPAGGRYDESYFGQVPGKLPVAPSAATLLGNNDLANAGNATFTGAYGTDNAGASMAGVGDVNSDGYPDFLIGAWAYPSGSGKGRAYLFYGNGSGVLCGNYNLAGAANATFTGEAGSDYAGGSVAGVGDLNGDGYADFLVGAYGYPGCLYQGRVYLFYGNGSGSTLRGDYALASAANATFTGGANDDTAGQSIAGAGDVNGDGYADFLVGATGYISDTGRAYLFYGNGSGNLFRGDYVLDNAANATFTGAASGDRAGVSVAGAGNVNGDGYADLLIGASGYGSNTGRSYLVYGNGAGATLWGDYNIASAANATFTGEASGDNAGTSTAGAGDVNGDGYADFLVSAAWYSSSTGRTYLVYGNGSGAALRGNYNLASAANATFTGETSNNLAGYRIAGAGDVNGDGYTDLLLGAMGYSSYKGRAYLIYGNGSGAALRGNYALASAANATFTGAAANNRAGFSVSGAGDVNGDGHADILVGACGYSGFAGRAYLFYGTSDEPAQIIDLAASSATPSSVNLTWTAPGNDGWDGIAVAYYLKVSASPINTSNWASATTILPPTPAAGGSRQSFLVTSLTPSTTCFFAMVADDGDGHVGPVSNSPHASTPDGNLPAIVPPSDITYTEGNAGAYSISWTITDSSTRIPTYTIRVDSGTPTSPSAWVPGVPVTYDVTGWAPGVYNVEITAADGYGGTTTDVVAITVNAQGIGWGFLPAFLLGTMGIAVVFLMRKARGGQVS